jgi:hypothetical protein
VILDGIADRRSRDLNTLLALIQLACECVGGVAPSMSAGASTGASVGVRPRFRQETSLDVLALQLGSRAHRNAAPPSNRRRTHASQVEQPFHTSQSVLIVTDLTSNLLDHGPGNFRRRHIRAGFPFILRLSFESIDASAEVRILGHQLQHVRRRIRYVKCCPRDRRRNHPRADRRSEDRSRPHRTTLQQTARRVTLGDSAEAST